MTVQRSGGTKRRVVARPSEPAQATATSASRSAKPQRGDAAKGTPPLPPKGAQAAYEPARFTPAANAKAFDLFAATLARALVRAQSSNLRPQLAAFHQALADLPVIITLERGHASLRGCLPKNAGERKAVEIFMASLPMHMLTVGPDRFYAELLGKLQQMIEGPYRVQDIWLGRGEKGAYELLVNRSPGDVVSSQAMTREVLAKRGEADGTLTQEKLLAPYAEADLSVIYGILKALEPMGLIDRPDLAAATALSADELRALARRIPFTTKVPRERVVAGLLRFISTQPAAALDGLREHVAVSVAEIRSLSRRLNEGLEPVSHGAAEQHPHVPWPIPPMFERVLEGMDPVDQQLVIGVIYARLRTGDYPQCKDRLGVSEAELEAMMASGSYATPQPPLALLERIFSMSRDQSLPEHWHDYVAVDRNGARELWARVVGRQRGRERVNEGVLDLKPGTHSIDGAKLFDGIAREHRAVVNECLNALLVNAFASADTLHSMTRMSREDLQRVLAGGTAKASIEAKELIALALRYVASSIDNARLWYQVMTASRDEVEDARKIYAP